MSEQIKRSDIAEKDLYIEIQKSASSALVEIDKLNEGLKESAKISSTQLKKNIKLADAQQIRETEKAIKEANVQFKQTISLEKEQDRLRKASEKARVDELKLQKAREKNIDDFNKKLETQNNAYKKLSDSSRALKNASKTLGAELLHLETIGKKNTSEYRLLERQYKSTTAQAIVLDSKLKGLDSRVGDNFRNVGNYQKAIGGLRNGLAQLGLSFGAFQLVGGSIKVLKNFEEASADIAKTVGITIERAKELSREFLNFDTRTSIEGLQQIATIGGQLGIAENDIVGFTKAVDKLNVALGDEFTGGAEEITSVIGGLRNVFSDIKTGNVENDLLGIGNALNELGASGSATAPIVSDFAGRIGGVAIPLGLTTGQVLGLSATLQELQVNSERGGTAVTKILQKMTTNTKDFAEIAGLSLKDFEKLVNTDINQAFQLVVKNVNKSGTSATDLAKKLDKLGIDGAGASEVFLKLSSNMGLLNSRIDLATKSLKEQDSITNEFNVKNNTLSATIDKLTKEFQKYVLGLDEAGNVSGKIGGILQFLINNFSTITSVLGKLLVSFIAYKTITTGARIAQTLFNAELRKGMFSFKSLGASVKDADGNVSKFGNALKGVGWTVAIGLAFELGKAIWDIVSGAENARFQMERLAKMDEFNKKRAIEQNKKVSNEIDSHNQKIKAQVELMKLEGASQKEINKFQKEAEQDFRDKLEKDINLANFKLFYLRQRYNDLTNEIKERKSQGLGVNGLERERKELKGQIDAIRERNNVRQSYFNVISIENEETIKNTDTIIKQTKEQKNLNTAYEDYLKIRKELSLDEYAPPEILFSDVERADELIKSRRKSVSEIKVLNAELYGNEEDLRKARIEQIQSDLELELENIELSLVEKERLTKEAELKIRNLEKESLNERRKNQKEYIDFATDYFIKRSEDKITQLDKEIDANQKQYNTLQELAVNGNITAQQSLAEQQRLINEANKKKADEQKKIERLKLLAIEYDIYQKNLEQTNSSSKALAKTIIDVQALQQLANLIPTFEKGTEDTGKNGLGIDGKGGFLSVLHPNEAVINKEDNAKRKGLTNKELVDVGYKFKTGQLLDVRKIDNAGNSFDLIPLMNEIKSLKQAVIDKPVTNVELGRITQSVMQIVNTTKAKNKTESKIFNIR